MIGAGESGWLRRGNDWIPVDRAAMLGGVCTNTGTIPSKSLREAILKHVAPGLGWR